MEQLLPDIAANSIGSAVAAEHYGPYPAYRDSGVEWLGDIPAHWELKRLRFTVTKCQNGLWGDEPDGEGDVVCVRVADFDRVAYRVKVEHLTLRSVSRSVLRTHGLNSGDLLLEKSGGGENQLVGTVVLNTYGEDAVCSNFIARMPVKDGFDSRYLTYIHAALYADQVNSRSIKQNTGIQNLDSRSYLNEVIAFPELQEQCVVATYLDGETAKIDALVAKKERLIELFHEKRAAVITRAVTKGIDPDAQMKYSGVVWLGEIPSHWEIRQLNRVIDKFVDYRGKTPEKVPYGVPLVTARNIKNQMIDFSDSKEFISEELYPRWMVRGLPEPGDVIVTTEAPLGECAQVNGTKIALAQRIILLKAMQDKISNDYLKYHFVSDFGQHELQTRSTGSTALGVKASHLKVSLIVVPPIEEQVQIATLLDRETARIDALVSKIREAIDRLKELRITLIAAAVTGKIDVRRGRPVNPIAVAVNDGYLRTPPA